jgi:hypothetical protein
VNQEDNDHDKQPEPDTAMHPRARRGKRLGTRIRTRQPYHLMARLDQFLNNCRTDKACSTGNEYTHYDFSFAFILSVEMTTRAPARLR